MNNLNWRQEQERFMQIGYDRTMKAARRSFWAWRSCKRDDAIAECDLLHRHLDVDTVPSDASRGGAQVVQRTDGFGGLQRVVGPRRAQRVTAHLGLGETVPSMLAPERWVNLFETIMACAAHDLDWRVAGAERRLRSQQRRLHKIHRTRWRRLRPPPGRYHTPACLVCH